MTKTSRPAMLLAFVLSAPRAGRRRRAGAALGARDPAVLKALDFIHATAAEHRRVRRRRALRQPQHHAVGDPRHRRRHENAARPGTSAGKDPIDYLQSLNLERRSLGRA